MTFLARLRCTFAGHRWVTAWRHAWALGPFTVCTRCGHTTRRGVA